MATWYVYSGGDNSPGYGTTDREDPSESDNWTNAFTTLDTAFTAASSDDLIYMAQDHVESTGTSYAYFTGAGDYIEVIRVNRSTGVLDDSTATYNLDHNAGVWTFDGNYNLRGIWINGELDPKAGSTDMQIYEDCTIKLQDKDDVSAFDDDGFVRFLNCTFDCGADTGATTNAILYAYKGPNTIEVIGCTLQNNTYRGAFIDVREPIDILRLIGNDLSALVGAKDIVRQYSHTEHGLIEVTGNILPSDADMYSTNGYGHVKYEAISNDSGSSIVKLHYSAFNEDAVCTEDTTTYLDGTWLSTPYSLHLDTGEYSHLGRPAYTPWINGELTGSGTKTFTVHITHESEGSGTSSDFLDSECWLELEYFGSGSTSLLTHISDRALTPAVAADQDDDTAAAWTAGKAVEQKLVLASVSVGRAGFYRWRVGCAVPEMTDGVYIDPAVDVT